MRTPYRRIHDDIALLSREYSTATSSEILMALHCSAAFTTGAGWFEGFEKRDKEELRRRAVPDPKLVKIMRRRMLERAEGIAA